MLDYTSADLKRYLAFIEVTYGFTELARQNYKVPNRSFQKDRSKPTPVRGVSNWLHDSLLDFSGNTYILISQCTIVQIMIVIDKMYY